MAKTLLQTTQPEVSKTGKPVFVHIDQPTKLLDLIGPEVLVFGYGINYQPWLAPTAMQRVGNVRQFLLR